MSGRKVALVAHGMDAVGTVICRRLHRDGFRVAVAYPPQQATPEAWLAAQRDEGYAFSTWRVDVRDFAGCAAMVSQLIAAQGQLDVLVYLAATDAAGCDDAGDAWRTVHRDTLDGAFNLDKQVLAPMLARQWGRIIHVAPGPERRDAQERALCATAGQAAARAGLHGLTKSLALEVARHGVTVNTIVPGALARDNAGSGFSAIEGVEGQIPVGRLGSGADVAGWWLIWYRMAPGSSRGRNWRSMAGSTWRERRSWRCSARVWPRLHARKAEVLAAGLARATHAVCACSQRKAQQGQQRLPVAGCFQSEVVQQVDQGLVDGRGDDAGDRQVVRAVVRRD